MVRAEAARGLGKMNTESARTALQRLEHAGVAQPRVLAAVLEALAEFTVSAEAHEAMLKHADAHALFVGMAAVTGLGRMRANPELLDRSLAKLQMAARPPSRRIIRWFAFSALQLLDDARVFDTVLELAQPARGDELRDRAIETLGHLGRRDSLRDRTRGILTGWLFDPDANAQWAAVLALGALGDPRSIVDLERVRNSARSQSLRNAAKDAIEAIQRPEDPKRATSALLERLAAIEQQNQQVEKKLRELTDQVGAIERSGRKKPTEKLSPKSKK